MRVVITGGSSGLGLAMAKRFVADGHEVHLLSRKAPSEIVDGAVHHAADLADIPEAVAAFRQAASEGVDVLINNAGVMQFENAHDTTVDSAATQIAVNLTAPIHLSTAAIAVMQAQESGGQIVNVASVAALKASPKLAVYSATKAGLIAYTKSVAAEYAGKRIRANAICPGAVQTGLANRLMWAMIQKSVPMGKLQSPEEVASLAAWLVSGDARHVTGSVFSLDGGMSL
jgi:NAD(P)-dependent dehydrogenase (short-subunit alcohol dehydrogenase family)